MNKQAKGAITNLAARLLAPGTRTALGAGLGAASGGYAGWAGSDPNRRPSKRFLSAITGAMTGGALGAGAGALAPHMTKLVASSKLGDKMELLGRYGKSLKQVHNAATPTALRGARRTAAVARRTYKASPYASSKIGLENYGKAGLMGAGALAGLTGAGYTGSRIADEMFKY